MISAKTNISEGVIGMFFLAVATSFPEIVTSATAVFSFGRIGLGYSDIMGSVIVNLMILFVLDVLHKKGRILTEASHLTRLTGFFVPVVTGILLAGAVMRMSGIELDLGKRMGLESILVIASYLFYLNMVRRSNDVKKPVDRPDGGSFYKIWAKFAFFLFIVMLLGIWMAKIGDDMMVKTGLSQTFAGALMLGVATSLPEIIVSFAAFRASSIDMAVGNVLGSNLFDVCIVPVLDGLSPGPIMGLLTPGQIIATVLALVLSLIAVAGLLVKRARKGRISWDTALIFIVGFSGFVILYFVK